MKEDQSALLSNRPRDDKVNFLVPLRQEEVPQQITTDHNRPTYDENKRPRCDAVRPCLARTCQGSRVYLMNDHAVDSRNDVDQARPYELVGDAAPHVPLFQHTTQSSVCITPPADSQHGGKAGAEGGGSQGDTGRVETETENEVEAETEAKTGAEIGTQIPCFRISNKLIQAGGFASRFLPDLPNHGRAKPRGSRSVLRSVKRVRPPRRYFDGRTRCGREATKAPKSRESLTRLFLCDLREFGAQRRIEGAASHQCSSGRTANG